MTKLPFRETLPGSWGHLGSIRVLQFSPTQPHPTLMSTQISVNLGLCKHGNTHPPLSGASGLSDFTWAGCKTALHCGTSPCSGAVGWAWGNLQMHSCFSLMSPDSLSLRVRQNGSTHIDLRFPARKGRRCLSLDTQILMPGFLVVNICLDITRLWDLLL